MNQSLKTIIQKNQSPPQIGVVDETDYSTYGFIPAQVRGNLKLESPVGVFHNNTDFSAPDIHLSVNDQFDTSIPVNPDGSPIQGAYTVTYTTQLENVVSDVDTGADFFEIFDDKTALIPIGSIIEIEDSTGNDGSYTVLNVTLVSGNTRVFVSSIPDGTIDGNLLFYWQKSYQNSYFYKAPEVSITQTASCNCAQFESQDTSSYTISYTGQYNALVPTTISRTHTVKYPAGIIPAKADVVTSNATITLNDLYTTNYWSVVETELEYTLPDGTVIIDTVSKSCSFEVVCSLSVCEVSTCLGSLYKKYAEALTTGHVNADRYQTKMVKATSLYVLYSLAVQCGNESAAQDAANQLKGVAESEGCNCGCGGQNCDPVQILPLCGSPGGGSGNTVIVQSILNGVTVTSSTVGTTTTYSVGLDYALVSGSLAASNVEVVAGVITSKFVSPGTLRHWWTSGLVGSNRVVMTNGSGIFIGDTIGTAHNKNFGTGVNNIVEIGATLGTGKTVKTDATGKIVTVDTPYELNENDYVPASTTSTTETDLKTLLLSANHLSQNKQAIKISGTIRLIGDGLFRIRTGTGVFAMSIFGGGGSMDYWFEVMVTRTGTNSQSAQVSYSVGAPNNVVSQVRRQIDPYTNDMTASLLIRITGQSQFGVGTVTVQNFKIETYR